MKGKHILALILSLTAICSCVKNELNPEFVKSDAVRLVVSGREMLRYDELTFQMAYNSTLHEFRVHTDNMSDYYIVRLSKVPNSVNQEVSGEIVWNTASGDGSINNTAFKAVRLEGGKIWLWDAADNVAVIVCCL